MPLCRVPKQRHSAKTHFAVCQKIALGKIHICRVPEKRHSAKTHFVECFFPSVFHLALGKDRLCRVSDKIHSAKSPALGKVPFSSSEMSISIKSVCANTIYIVLYVLHYRIIYNMQHGSEKWKMTNLDTSYSHSDIQQ